MIYGAARDARLLAGYGRWYARTWLVPAAGLAGFLAGFWPLLVFRRHWTSTVAIPCYPDAWVRYGAQCTGTYRAPVPHGAVSGLGVALTAGWLLLAAALVVLAVAASRRVKVAADISPHSGI